MASVSLMPAGHRGLAYVLTLDAFAAAYGAWQMHPAPHDQCRATLHPHVASDRRPETGADRVQVGPAGRGAEPVTHVEFDVADALASFVSTVRASRSKTVASSLDCFGIANARGY